MRSIEQQISNSEEILVQQAKDGNLEAFNQLVLSYQNLAYNHACALLGDSASAEDVTQESFIKAFQGLDKFRGGSFRSWLLRIATNTAYDIQRKSKAHPTQPLIPEDEYGEEMESPAWLADPGPSVQSQVEQKEFLQSIYRMLGELPEVYRSVIILVDLDELDYTDTASALNIPIGTVKSRLARARLQMQKKLQQDAFIVRQSNALA